MATRTFLCVLTVFLFVGSLQAQQSFPKIRLAGVRATAECSSELSKLQAELTTLHYPAEWTIEISCTTIAWEQAWRKAGGPPTTRAFTQLKNKITILNGSIFRENRSAYRRSISHELAHILCACKNEDDAQVLAQKLESSSSPPQSATD